MHVVPPEDTVVHEDHAQVVLPRGFEISTERSDVNHIRDAC